MGGGVRSEEKGNTKLNRIYMMKFGLITIWDIFNLTLSVVDKDVMYLLHHNLQFK